MDILTRNLANLFWLEKFTVFKPENLRPLTGIDKNLMSWGNYSIGQNLYPQLFEAFIKYSPTANFILNKLQTQDGRLFHRYRDGESAIMGQIDDYAFLILGLI